MRGEDTFAIADLADYAPYQAGDTLTRAIVDLAGARSVVITPLRKDAAVLGAITLYRQEVLPFTDKQIALLENFAAQAVIAMENARLITEQREALADRGRRRRCRRGRRPGRGRRRPCGEQAVIGGAARQQAQRHDEADAARPRSFMIP